MLEYQNIKNFLEKTMFQVDLKKTLWLKKLKILLQRHMLLAITEITGTFYEKELQKTNPWEFWVEKCDKLYVQWKSYDSSFISCIDKADKI